MNDLQTFKFGYLQYLHGITSTNTLYNLVPIADSFTSVLDGVAQDLNVDDALNIADQVVLGMHSRHYRAPSRQQWWSVQI